MDIHTQVGADICWMNNHRLCRNDSESDDNDGGDDDDDDDD